MADEELDQQVAPEQGKQETIEQQAEREEAEGKLDAEGKVTESPDSQSDTSDNGDDAAAKRRDRTQKRIDQLTKQRHEALREAEKLREENRKLKEQQTVQPPADDPRPQFDDYDSTEKYEQDIGAWSRRQAKREAEATQQPEAGPTVEDQQAIDRVQNAALAASDKYPDFEQVVYDTTLPLTQEMVRVAADSDHVADVLYHLGKNREEATRLSQLTGPSLIREMGRLEARLEAQQSGNGAAQGQQEQSQTSAPDPIQPVRGSKAKREPTNPDKLDIDTWMAREWERIAQQRR